MRKYTVSTKIADKNVLVAMAMEFSSYLVSKKDIGHKINTVILFGSVARGDQDNESDVDIFIDSENSNEKEIRKVLDIWETSKMADKWRLIGAINPIALHIGRLGSWEAIHRVILTEGIVLYGKYIEQRSGGEQQFLITLDFSGLAQKNKVSLWRQLYGYRQKAGGKIYETVGLVKNSGGKRLSFGTLMIPVESVHNIIDFLKNKKVKFTALSIWVD